MSSLPELPSETLQIVSRTLGLKDMHNLKCACSVLRTLVTGKMFKSAEDHLTQVVTTRLEDFFEDKFVEFSAILQQARAVISGSFLVQSSTGNTWEDSDIDIYIPNSEATSRKFTPLEDFLFNGSDSWARKYTKEEIEDQETMSYFSRRLYQVNGLG